MNEINAIIRPDRLSGVILLVEDQPAVLQVLERQLTRLGFQVLPADGGTTALAAIFERGGAIDLVLTDIDMPGMDGRTLGRAVNRLYPEVPVIYMSGRPGACVLEKPFSASRLAAELQAALNTR